MNEFPMQRMRVNAKNEMEPYPQMTEDTGCKTRYPNDPEKPVPETRRFPLIVGQTIEPFTCDWVNQ